ncbi:uncharacterized protein LOC111080333 [Drosophila obscura]|uniref:uncharacterized protein LOC111080333 n=1 Tax=Drosophila obscura TaxID=7282 RepID=UPI001BB20154|nr:uncharacterized protein LOC111080333 [Drosophila obscura]
MNSSHTLMKILLLALLLLGDTSARHLTLRPLSRAEIHELESTQPLGRSVSSGFAAVTGFAIGLGKALTGVFIYDVITANVTDIEESESSASEASVREFCFDTGSKSGNDLTPYYDDGDGDADVEEELSFKSSNAMTTCIVYYKNDR